MKTKLLHSLFQALHQPRKKFRWTLKEKEDISKLAIAKKQVQRLEQVNWHQAWTIGMFNEKNASMFLRNAEFTRLKIVEQLGERRSTLLVDASLFSNTFHSGDQLMQQEQSVLLDVAVFHSLKRIPLSTGMFSKLTKLYFQMVMLLL